MNGKLDQPLSDLVDSTGRRNGRRHPRRDSGRDERPYRGPQREPGESRKRRMGGEFDEDRRGGWSERCPTITGPTTGDDRMMTAFKLTEEEHAFIKRKRAERFGLTKAEDKNNSKDCETIAGRAGDVNSTCDSATMVDKGSADSGLSGVTPIVDAARSKSKRAPSKLDLSLDEILDPTGHKISQRNEYDPTSNERPESLYVYGAQSLSKEDAKEIFSQFDLHHIQWLNNSAFNAVFNNPEDATKALTSLATIIEADTPWWSLSSKELQATPKYKQLIFRISTEADYGRSGNKTGSRQRYVFKSRASRYAKGSIWVPNYVGFDDLDEPDDIGREGKRETWGNQRLDMMSEDGAGLLGEEFGI